MDLFQAGSTSTAVTKVEQGVTTSDIALLAQFADQGSTITFPEGGVTAAVTNFQTINSGGQTFQLYTLSITAEENAALGDRSLLLTNSGGVAGPAAPGLLSVVPPGSLGQAHAGDVAEVAAPAASYSEARPRKIDPEKIKLPKQRY
jgi:hypothetical protein